MNHGGRHTRRLLKEISIFLDNSVLRFPSNTVKNHTVEEDFLKSHPSNLVNRMVQKNFLFQNHAIISLNCKIALKKLGVFT